MNILEKLMNVFRKRERVEPRWKEGTEPSHGFGFAEAHDKAFKMAKLKKQIEETKQDIADAKRRKKKVSYLYDRLIDLKAQQLKLEGK